MNKLVLLLSLSFLSVALISSAVEKDDITKVAIVRMHAVIRANAEYEEILQSLREKGSLFHQEISVLRKNLKKKEGIIKAMKEKIQDDTTTKGAKLVLVKKLRSEAEAFQKLFIELENKSERYQYLFVQETIRKAKKLSIKLGKKIEKHLLSKGFQIVLIQNENSPFIIFFKGYLDKTNQAIEFLDSQSKG